MKYRSLEKRIRDLETKHRASSGSSIIIDMMDHEVRVIRGAVHEKPRVFETVFQAARYVEQLKATGANVTGIVFASYIGDLFYDRPCVPVPGRFLKHTGVVMNLAKWTTGSLEDLAIVTWDSLHPDPNTLNPSVKHLPIVDGP